MLSYLQQFDSEIRGIFVLEVFSKRQESVVKIILVISYCLKCVDHLDLVEASDMSVTNPNRGDIIKYVFRLNFINCSQLSESNLWQFVVWALLPLVFKKTDNVSCSRVLQSYEIMYVSKKSILMYSFIF